MARQARGKSMNPAKVQVFHTVQRCVRRAFLCGEDAVSGKSYDHRKQWIRERLEFLASIFAIDLLTYTVLSNHLHLVNYVTKQWVATDRNWSHDHPKSFGFYQRGTGQVKSLGFQIDSLEARKKLHS